MAVAVASELEGLGLAPIPGDAPAGKAARYEPEYEDLLAEIENLGSLTGKRVDWEKVIERGTSLLREKSKDLLVATYLTFALYQLRGLPGLVGGLTVTRDMLRAHWDGLFPELKRARARVTALQWLVQRLQPAIEGLGTPSESDREPLGACAQLLQEIQQVCDEKLGREAPALGPMRRAFEARVQAIPAAAPEPPPPPPPPPEPAPGAVTPAAAAAPAPAAVGAPPPPPPPPPPPSAPADVSGVQDTLNGVWETLHKTADLLFAASDADPLSYLLRRTAAWRGLVKPPAATGNQLGFPGGDPGVLAQLDAAQNAGDHAGVLRLAEPVVARQRLWIEPSFRAFLALEALGKRYEAARDALGSELLALLRRLPQLADLSFKNGLPLLGPEGRTWLSAQSSGAGGGGGGADALDAALGAARGKLADGLAAALEAFDGAAPARLGLRGRFRWRLGLARLSLEANRADLALGQLEGLDGERLRHALDEWEPALAAELLTLRLKALQALQPKPKDAPERARAIFDALCQVDLPSALALGPL